ncbi:autotransporter domain-containing protein [Desulfovibrio sp. OttesenSCG-928-C14]|nr:autotransporter domain-containing protein [Desulfovibrio sp. OttesenSCG-928-C14]
MSPVALSPAATTVKGVITYDGSSTLDQYEFSHTNGVDLSGAIGTLHSAIVEYTEGRAGSDVPAAIQAYQQTLAGWRGQNSINSLHVDGNYTLSTTGSDQRLVFGLDPGQSEVGELQVKEGHTLTISGNRGAPNAWGAALNVSNGSVISVSGPGKVVFKDNRTHDNAGLSGGGGAVHIYNSTALFQNADFIDNRTDSLTGGGGAINVIEGSLTLIDTYFEKNRSYGYGGAVSADASQAVDLAICGSIFKDNHSTEGGGAVYSKNGGLFIADSKFTGNSTDFSGGAIYKGYHAIYIINSDFIQNSAVNQGGAIYRPQGAPLYLSVSQGESSLFSGNIAAGKANSVHVAGGALYIDTAKDAVLDMRDPLSSSGGQTTKSGDGVWKLGGTNLFISSIMINAGTLYLYAAGEVGNPTTADPEAKVEQGHIYLNNTYDDFYLWSGASLQMGGQEHQISAGRQIYFSTGSSLIFNLAGTFPESTPSLQLSSNKIKIENGLRIVLGTPSISSGRGYTLVKAVDGTFTDFSDYVFEQSDDATVRRLLSPDNAGNTDTSILYVNLLPEASSGNLTWAGSDTAATWNAASDNRNWLSAPAMGGKQITWFLNGDSVTFDGTGHTTVTVGTAVTADKMTVTGSGYTFSGSKISGAVLDLSGSAVFETETAFSGMSSISGSATFKNDFSFAGGASVGNGASLTVDVAEDVSRTLNSAFSGGGTISKTGDGSLTLGGDNSAFTGALLHTGGTTALASGKTLGGDVTVSTGLFKIASGAKVAGSLGLQGGALTGTGLISQNLTFAGGTLSYDVADENPLEVGGAAQIAGGKSAALDLTVWSAGTYRILKAASGLNDAFFSTLTIAGASPGVRNKYSFNMNDDVLELIINAGNARNLTWDGSAGNSAWNTSDKNWVEADESFSAYDFVSFNGNAAGKEVALGENALVSGMEISGGDYTFTGADKTISGTDQADDNGQHRTGRIAITGGSAVFETKLDFKNGYLVSSGASMTYAGASIKGDIENQGGFTFKNAHNLNYQGQLKGAGSFTKTGRGILRLGRENHSGTGAFNLAEGSLEGSFSYQGDLVAQRDTTLLPGSSENGVYSTGRIALSSLTLEAGSTLAMGLTESDSSRIHSSGKVKIDSNALLVLLNAGNGEWSSGNDYTLIDAEAIDRVFANVDSTALPFLEVRQDLREGKELHLVTVYNSGAAQGAAQSPNENAAASGVGGLPFDHDVQKHISGLGSTAEARQAFNALSGEVHAGVKGALASSDRRGGQQILRNVSRQVAKHRPKPTRPPKAAEFEVAAGPVLPGSGPAAHLVPVAKISDKPGPAASGGLSDALWIEGFGSRETMTDDGNAGRSKLSGTGISGGAHFQSESGWFTGLVLRYADREYEINSRDSKIDINSVTAAIYGGRGFSAGPGTLRLTTGGAYTRHDLESKRQALGSTLEASYSADVFQGFGELAYELSPTQTLRVEPYVSGLWNLHKFDAVKEKGGPAALRGRSSSKHSAAVVAGLRADARVYECLTLSLDMGWEHVFGSRAASSRMAFRDGAGAFNVSGSNISRNSFLLGAGLSVSAPGDNLSVGIIYDGSFSSRATSHGGSVKVIYRW